MNHNELHAVSLLLRGASTTLIVIDDKNPATHVLAECFVSLISSFHNTAHVIGSPTAHPLISYSPSPTYPTTFTTTLKNSGKILATQQNDTITFSSTHNPEISVAFPFDCLIILTTAPFTTSSFLVQNQHLLSAIPSILVTNEPHNPYPTTHTVTSTTRTTLAQVVCDFLQSLNTEITAPQATALLACLYQETQFLTQPLSPKTVSTASYLLEKGAHHEKIMSGLLRNKSHDDLLQLGKLYSQLICDEKTGIAYSPIPFPFHIAQTAAHEIFTSLRNIHLCVFPESRETATTYHLWSDNSLSLSTILPPTEGDITKNYAKITTNQSISELITYLQHRIESL